MNGRRPIAPDHRDADALKGLRGRLARRAISADGLGAQLPAAAVSAALAPREWDRPRSVPAAREAAAVTAGIALRERIGQAH